jgi:dUTP pyrophosphatase
MVLDSGKFYGTGFYMYPRSSLSKTRLRLANSVGIIDSGYRGHLIGAFDALDDYSVQAGDRLVQVCAPGLVPIMVTVLDDLGDVTARGSGGFGSTGR